MQAHLSDMDRDLRAAGFAGELLVVTSFGGVLRLEDTTQRPLYTVNSGPAMAPVAGKEVAAPIDNIVVCDTGGTSFDVSVVRGGEVQFTRETWLDGLFTGHITGLSSVDVKNVGAGGGSIAWIDSGGLLRVGPQSAGAEPGPACYGHGGTDATVTDAAVVLGYIDPAYFLGGKLELDAAAAHSAVERAVAGPLGFSVQRAAWAILAVANEHMVGAVREITINQGIDPRESIVIAGGGAGGLTMSKIAEELGCDKVLVPQTAAALSATGGLLGDVVAEFTVSRRADTNAFDRDAVNEGLADLDRQIEAFFAQMDVPADARMQDYVVEARYPYQVWELDVALPSKRFESQADVDALVAAFHETHERVFAVKELGQSVECLYWKGRARVHLPKPTLAAATGEAQGAPSRRTAPDVVGRRRSAADARVPGRGAVARRAHRRACSRRAADDDRRRLSRLDGDRDRAGRLPARAGARLRRRSQPRGGRMSAEPRQTFDPILLAVVANRLDGICREMTNTLLRSARSSVINQARDFSCALVTADNELLASAEGLPVHIMGSQYLAEAMTELHDDLSRGDAFLHNDPYLGNTHSADHAILVPVVVDGEHLFTAVAKAHQADCGNGLPTTYVPGAKDVYDEGALTFPCVRVQRDFENVEDIIRMCRSRIRVPEQWYGDFLAGLGAARIAERRLEELCAHYGVDVIRDAIREWFDYSERRMDQAIQQAPVRHAPRQLDA